MTKKKNKKFELTSDVLLKLQEAMSDSIRPDYRDDKKDGKKRKKSKKGKKAKSPDGSAERNQPETTVSVQPEGS